MEREGEEEVDEDNDGYGNKELFKKFQSCCEEEVSESIKERKKQGEKNVTLEKPRMSLSKKLWSASVQMIQKTSQVIEEVFSKNVSVKKSVDNKSFKETTFFEVIEEGLSSMRTVVRVSKLKKI